MKLLYTRNKLLQLDQLIRLQVKGTPKELMDILDLSEATFYRYLNTLKILANECNTEIIYNKNSLNYFYTKEVKLKFEFISQEKKATIIF